jgi:hypothetical protein
MKRIMLGVLVVFAAFSTVFFTSCESDPCDQITCAYSGTCQDGKCKCQVGYEGIHCETIMRDKFLGIWNVNEDGSLSGKSQYVASIEKGDVINQVKLFNVQNIPMFKISPVIATVKNDTITIPMQTMPDNTKIQGWGHIAKTNALDQHYYQHAVLTFYYEITNPLGQINKYGFPDGDASIWSK